MMIIIVIIFGICWLPQHLYFILININSNINNHPHIQEIYLIIFWLAMSNSMYNPLVYCYMNARFRAGFKFIFRWLPCVQYDRGLDGGRGTVVWLRNSHTAINQGHSVATTSLDSYSKNSSQQQRLLKNRTGGN